MVSLSELPYALLLSVTRQIKGVCRAHRCVHNPHPPAAEAQHYKLSTLQALSPQMSVRAAPGKFFYQVNKPERILADYLNMCTQSKIQTELKLSSHQ